MPRIWLRKNVQSNETNCPLPHDLDLSICGSIGALNDMYVDFFQLQLLFARHIIAIVPLDNLFYKWIHYTLQPNSLFTKYRILS